MKPGHAVKSKKLHAKISKHSRTARRAESPSLNTDKSLKTVTEPSGKSGAFDVLRPQNTGGIKKSSKRGKKSLKEQLAAAERAEARQEMLGNKIQKKVEKHKVVDKRRVGRPYLT
jgi:hypothetical protein